MVQANLTNNSGCVGGGGTQLSSEKSTYETYTTKVGSGGLGAKTTSNGVDYYGEWL